MNDNSKINGAREAANQADNIQPSHWTAGKTPKTDAEIAALNNARPEKTEKRIVRAEPPVEAENLRVSKPKTKAAGFPAIAAMTGHAVGKMGVGRALKTLSKVNKHGGIDCTSCAWADPDGERHIAEICENGGKAIADEATTKKLTREFFQKYTVRELAEKSDQWLNAQGRIVEPMILRAGKNNYEPISWENAFQLLAEELNSLESPNEAIFYTSGRASNEAAYLYQLFVRQFGTNNLPDCSNMCHESSGTALTETIGIGKGTVTIEDFEHCDLIIVAGQNPGTNHPRMLIQLEHAKKNGAKIISINPLPEAGLNAVVNPNPQEYSNLFSFAFSILTHSAVELCDLHLPVKIGGDMAVFKGLMKFLLADETRLDHKFIEFKTAGFQDFKTALEQVSWQEIERESGLTRAQIEEAAAIYANSNRVITCWAMGLTQHKHAVGTIQEIVNLHLLRGQIGKQGAGLCPVRGHSNVQGDRTVGIWERPREEFLKALDAEFDFTAPREHGFDTIESIKAMHAGAARVFFALGGNFLSATPDTNLTAAALANCRLTAQIITKLNRTALVTGEQSLILPCLGRTEIDVQTAGEQFVSCENSMGVVQMSKGVLKPASENLRSETWIVANLAKTVLSGKSKVDWDKFAGNYDAVRDSIERVIPGFDDYNRRVREKGGFYLPNKPRECEFPTATGKANFTVHALPKIELQPDELIMMTIRSHDQFNTTVYDAHDRYRGIHGARRVILMNSADIGRLGLANGQIVDLTSNFEGETRTAKNFAVVPYPIPPGCAATYFPETNVLVPLNSAADRSNTPTSKFVRINVAPHNV